MRSYVLHRNLTFVKYLANSNCNSTTIFYSHSKWFKSSTMTLWLSLLLLSLQLLIFHLFFSALVIQQPRRNPCIPSPCGPYSLCRVVDDRPVCSCNVGYSGAPPNCRPECIVSSECPLDKACVKQKCVDPCPGTCGFNAFCKVVAHNPICSCPPGYIGDPFSKCVVEQSKHAFRALVHHFTLWILLIK